MEKQDKAPQLTEAERLKQIADRTRWSRITFYDTENKEMAHLDVNSGVPFDWTKYYLLHQGTYREDNRGAVLFHFDTGLNSGKPSLSAEMKLDASGN